MAITPPTSDDLAEIAQRYRLGLDAADIESFRGIIAGALASSDAVEDLYAAGRPEASGRAYRWPDPADNELGAWYVTSEIPAAGDGPLAGRRVAIKDNIEVAGLPMMNGSATVEGFVPRRDATVVTRVLDAGATITGKAVCEDLCFSGGSHTSRSGPVRNPWDRTKSAGGSSGGSAALADADVLVMPTLPIVASTIPPADASREEKLARSLEMIPNTAPFDVSGHPATSVPAGLSDGLPVGMMIVGRRGGDGTCLRVARAYESAVGGFPTPPAR